MKGDNSEMLESRIKEKKIKKNSILIGGHPRWQKFFMMDNPEVKVINPQKKQIDSRILMNASTIYLNIHHMKHSQYETVMNVVRKNNLPIQYVR